MLKRIHHVAFAHPEGFPMHGLLGQALGVRTLLEVAGEGFVERMMPVGEGYLQLLEATGPGVVQRFLDRRGPALHHVGFEVDDLAAAVASLQTAGIRLVDPAPRSGGMGTSIAFVHPSALGGLLVELVQPPPGARHGWP